MKGTAYGVGVGPGDPELITVKAIRLIRENEVIAGHTKAVKEMLTSSNREASAVLNCGMDGEQVCRRIEEIPDDAGYFSLIISRQHGGRS